MSSKISILAILLANFIEIVIGISICDEKK
jgi:hypothetical protein